MTGWNRNGLGPLHEQLSILHCLRAPVGGLFRHVRDLALEQARRGHAVGIVCDSTTGGPEAAAHLDALAPSLALGVRRLPMGRQIDPRDIAVTLAVQRHCRHVGASILHGHGAKGGAYARLAAAALRRRTGGGTPLALYTPHGGSLHYDPASLAGRLFLGLERRLLRFTDGLAFESAFSAGRYRARVGTPACPVRIAPNGLGPADFTAHAPGPEAADFLFIGELRRLKGVDVLLHALAHLAQEGRRTTTIIVGEGPDRQRFERLAADLGLEPSVHFAGAMPASRAFALARCLVVPSRAESFPYIVLEGAAAAIPMILTDVGGIPEITAGTPVPLLPPGDARALAARLAAFLDQPATFRAESDALRAEVRAKFTIERMADAILDLYAAARRARRRSAAAATAGPTPAKG